MAISAANNHKNEKTKLDWTIDQETLLIEKIHKDRFMWDAKDKDYLNRSKSWINRHKIAEHLNKYQPHRSGKQITAQEVRRKWTNLRSYFIRMVAHKKQNKPEGVAAGNRAWIHYSRLCFLIDGVNSTSCMDTLSATFDTPKSIVSQNAMEEYESKVDPLMLVSEEYTDPSPEMWKRTAVVIKDDEGVDPPPPSLGRTEFPNPNLEIGKCPYTTSIKLMADEVIGKIKRPEDKLKAHAKVMALFNFIGSDRSLY